MGPLREISRIASSLKGTLLNPTYGSLLKKDLIESLRKEAPEPESSSSGASGKKVLLLLQARLSLFCCASVVFTRCHRLKRFHFGFLLGALSLRKSLLKPITSQHDEDQSDAGTSMPSMQRLATVRGSRTSQYPPEMPHYRFLSCSCLGHI